MCKKLRKKLRSSAGETLAEVLVAMMIISFAVMMLVSMISTAFSIDKQTRERDKKFYENLGYAETLTTEEGSANPAEDEVSITIGDDTEHPLEISVYVYGGGGLASYEKKSEVSEP